MCGIVGIVGPASPNGRDALQQMLAAIHHRGPDDHGRLELLVGDNCVHLGNTRLAIVDLSPAGHQPMHDPVTGNWIIYNGEVYNFLELRRALEDLGIAFSTNTDTEVVLHAYRVWGAQFLSRLRGMFAFAIWDATRREVFLARDRLGKKPLYYSSQPSAGFLFASEVRALLASGLVRRRLDPSALDVYLANGFLISPLTLVSGVRSLLPGHCLRVASEGRILECSRYWTLPAPARLTRNGEFSDLARSLLAESVDLRLISDVPLGAFLSGGLDSSIIVARMCRSHDRVRTFSVSFAERLFDESPYSRWVARKFSTDHSELRLTHRDFAELLPDALAALDQPSFDGLNTFCVARAARGTGLKVALSGLGADELFGGYPFFNIIPLLGKTYYLPAPLSHAVARLLHATPHADSFWGLSGISKTEELFSSSIPRQSRELALLAAYQTAQALFPARIRSLLAPHSPKQNGSLGIPAEFFRLLLEETAGESPVGVVSRLALRLFLGERCLRDTDSMSMAVSLEVRAPFTDHQFVSTLLGHPAADRCRGIPDKPYLQKLTRPLLGDDFPVRRKQGFIFPFPLWLREPALLRELESAATHTPSCNAIGLDSAAVAGIFTGFRRNPRRIPWSRVWALTVLVDWCRRHQVSR